MSVGGYREGSGRKKMPIEEKLQTKTFCIDKHIFDWLKDKYPKKESHSLVRNLLQDQYNEEMSL